MKSISSVITQTSSVSLSPVLIMAEMLRKKEKNIMEKALKKGFQPWEARDIYQDVCQICIEESTQKDIKVPVGYVLAVTRNLIAEACERRNLKRKQNVPLEGEVLLRCQEELSYEYDNPGEQQAEHKLRVAVALGLLDELLPPIQGQILRLNLMEGLDLKEIAQHLNLSHANVRKKKGAALETLSKFSSLN